MKGVSYMYYYLHLYLWKDFNIDKDALTMLILFLSMTKMRHAFCATTQARAQFVWDVNNTKEHITTCNFLVIFNCNE